MKKIITIFALLSIILIGAETVSISPSDDMYTDAEHVGIPMEISQLWTADYDPAGQHQRIMIKFDLSEFEGRDVQSAIFNLTRFYSCPSGGTTVTTFYRITEAWTEDSWNVNQHVSYDAADSTPYAFIGNGGSTNVDFEVDISSFIQPWINGEKENFGFVIIANSNQKFSKFFSKEHSNNTQRPGLTVTYTNTDSDNETVPTSEITVYNYPNPFNPSTTICFSIDNPAQVELTIFDAKGKMVKNLIADQFTEGTYSKTWDGRSGNGDSVASGMYFYRIKVGKTSQTKKMILIK